MSTCTCDKCTPPQHTEEESKQEPFSRVAPLLKTALLMGAGGGFALATVLTLSLLLDVPLGVWWAAVAQVHGHLQLYGWAGLFVLGMLCHFLPRLRGTPLVGARSLPWLLGIMAVSLLIRAVSQPLVAIGLGELWHIGLLSSALLETGALGGILSLLFLTALRGPRPTTRPACWSVFPFFLGAFCTCGLASLLNLVNVVQATSGSGLVLPMGDTLNVTLGLFGFLVPVALAMSVRSLPMYAGLSAFPQRLLWPLAGSYFAGLMLLCVGIFSSGISSRIVTGLGMLLLGGVVLLCMSLFLRLMSQRGQVPRHVVRRASKPLPLAQSYLKRVREEQARYGPFVRLVASAYLWATLGALLLLLDGASMLATGSELVGWDITRHSFALGFIALLICGLAPRMVSSFSSGTIVSAKLVSATLWLGNSAAVLRVGSLLFAPLLTNIHGLAVGTFLLSLSGPCGLALALCLAINLWPALGA